MQDKHSTIRLAVISVTAFLAFTVLASLNLQEKILLLRRSPQSVMEKKDTIQEKVNLWLLVCETRNSSRALAGWMFTANHVQTLAANDVSPINVKIENICNGLPWQGFGTKLKSITDFLDRIVASKSKNSTKDDEHDIDSLYDVVDIVMLTDSDSFFNPWGVTVSQAVERFHIARKGKKILISAEPNCWNGSFCNQNVMNEVYPNAVRSSCPQFVNAGQYMGYAESLLTMVKSEEMSQWNRVNRFNDQQYLALWYSKNTEMAQLDVDSLVFRNLMTGYIDSRIETGEESMRDIFTCGSGDAVRNCSRFVKPYWGAVNATSLQVEMVPVTFPNCSVSQNPFSIHGAGPGKKFADRLVGQLQSDYRKKFPPP